ncbi:MAG: rRNA maturation RNase YbeY [Desulfobacterales bacterium]
MDCPEAELSIVIVDDAEIAELNQRYLQRSGPTNVLAFPMQEGEFGEISPHLLGDVVISADTAAREGREAGIPMVAHLIALLVHGILHLLGYDHETEPAQAREMDAKSRELLALLERRSLRAAR